MSYHIAFAALVVLASVAACWHTTLVRAARITRLTRALEGQVDLRAFGVLQFMRRQTLTRGGRR